MEFAAATLLSLPLSSILRPLQDPSHHPYSVGLAIDLRLHLQLCGCKIALEKFLLLCLPYEALYSSGLLLKRQLPRKELTFLFVLIYTRARRYRAIVVMRSYLKSENEVDYNVNEKLKNLISMPESEDIMFVLFYKKIFICFLFKFFYSL